MDAAANGSLTDQILNGINPDSPTFLYDLLVQNITIITVEGPSELSLTNIESFYKYKLLLATFFALRVGCSFVTALMLFLVVKNRTRPIYILNMTSLFFLFMNSTLYLGYLFSSYSSIASNFTGSYALGTKIETGVSVTCSLFQLLLYTSVLLSLILQVRAVFPQRSASCTTATAVVGAFGLVAFVFNLLFIIGRVINAVDSSIVMFSNSHFALILPTLSQIFIAATIAVTSIILIGKLLFAIRMRQILGLRQFGPMEIIFIMSTQTLVLPLVLYILNSAVNSTISNVRYASGISSLSVLVIVMTLPLSAIWCTTSNVTPISNSEIVFSRNRGSEMCVCGRSTYYDDDSDTHSYNTSVLSRYNQAQQLQPTTFGGKVKQLFRRLDYFIFKNAVYSVRAIKAQRRDKNCNSHDLESLSDSDKKFEATTKMYISNIETTSAQRNSRLHGIHLPNSFSKDNQAHVSVHRANSFTERNNEMETMNDQSVVVDHTGIMNYNMSSPTDTFVNKTPLIKQKTNNQSFEDDDSFDDSLTSPTTMASRSNYHKNKSQVEPNETSTRSAGNSGNVVFIDPELLSLAEDENDEEYYNRMKSRYKWSCYSCSLSLFLLFLLLFLILAIYLFGHIYLYFFYCLCIFL